MGGGGGGEWGGGGGRGIRFQFLSPTGLSHPPLRNFFALSIRFFAVLATAGNSMSQFFSLTL